MPTKIANDKGRQQRLTKPHRLAYVAPATSFNKIYRKPQSERERLADELLMLEESIEKRRRFIRDANDVVRCLTTKFDIEFGFPLAVVPVGKLFELPPPHGSEFSSVHRPTHLDPRERDFRVALSADGTWAVASCDTNFVLLWNLEAGHQGRRLECDRQTCDGVAISADGKRAVSGSLDGTIRVWDLDKECRSPPFGSGREGVRAMALSADGKLALIGGYGGLHLWRIYDQVSPQLLASNQHAFWSSHDGTKRCHLFGGAKSRRGYRARFGRSSG
ncbi:MAG: hypothetical protein ABSD75_31500 [Terriglobales bacterium]